MDMTVIREGSNCWQLAPASSAADIVVVSIPASPRHPDGRHLYPANSARCLGPTQSLSILYAPAVPDRFDSHEFAAGNAVDVF